MNMQKSSENIHRGCPSNVFIDFDLLVNPYCKIYFTY